MPDPRACVNDDDRRSKGASCPRSTKPDDLSLHRAQMGVPEPCGLAHQFEAGKDGHERSQDRPQFPAGEVGTEAEVRSVPEGEVMVG